MPETDTDRQTCCAEAAGRAEGWCRGGDHELLQRSQVVGEVQRGHVRHDQLRVGLRDGTARARARTCSTPHATAARGQTLFLFWAE
jgi:hypothetical protein